MGYDMCETMGVSSAVYAVFIDGVIDSLLVSCQHSVIPTTKPVEVYSVCTW